MKGMDKMDKKIQLYPINKFCMPLIHYYEYADKPISYHVEESSPLIGKDVSNVLNINGSLGRIESLKERHKI